MVRQKGRYVLICNASRCQTIHFLSSVSISSLWLFPFCFYAFCAPNWRESTWFRYQFIDIESLKVQRLEACFTTIISIHFVTKYTHTQIQFSQYTNSVILSFGRCAVDGICIGWHLYIYFNVIKYIFIHKQYSIHAHPLKQHTHTHTQTSTTYTREHKHYLSKSDTRSIFRGAIYKFHSHFILFSLLVFLLSFNMVQNMEIRMKNNKNKTTSIGLRE